MIIEMRTGETHRAPVLVHADGKLARWFELEMATLSIRYQFIRNAAGETVADQAQHQQAFKGRFKLDADGKYSIHAGAFPGKTFQGGWNSTGLGTGKARTNLYLKQLYFSAKPIHGVELQYGSLYFLHGESTEITSYDYDGYLEGERVSVTRPHDFWFDEASITCGYVGDLRQSNINKRYHRLKQSNYHQFLLAKNIGERTRVSADYTSESGEGTFRQAVKFRANELRVVDALQFENYERGGAQPGYGFGIYGEKRLHERFSFGGGFVRIDRNGLNSDRFLRGKRLHMNGHLTLNSQLSVTAAFTQGVGREVGGLSRTRLDVALNYNLLETLKKTRLFQ